jgi:peroxiredoxin
MRLFFVSLACASLLAVSSLAASELSGRRAPGFALLDTNGKMHDPADYRGKFLIVEFMQFGCPHCALFSDILEQVRTKYGEKIAILSIVNPPSKPEDAKRYIVDKKLKNPLLFDVGQVAYSYFLPNPQHPSVSVPYVFLIDRQGTIRNDIGYSEATKDIFEGSGIYAEIDKLMAGGSGGSKKK